MRLDIGDRKSFCQQRKFAAIILDMFEKDCVDAEKVLSEVCHVVCTHQNLNSSRHDGRLEKLVFAALWNDFNP